MTTLACSCGSWVSVLAHGSPGAEKLLEVWQWEHRGEGHEPTTLKRAQQIAQKKREAH